MFIQSRLLQNGRNSAPRAEYSTALKQRAQRLPGTAAPAPRGVLHIWISSTATAPGSPQTPCPSHRLHDRLSNQCGCHLTEDALKHPKRSLVTLNATKCHILDCLLDEKVEDDTESEYLGNQVTATESPGPLSEKDTAINLSSSMAKCRTQLCKVNAAKTADYIWQVVALEILGAWRCP